MNTKSLILKKGLLIKNYMNTIPLIFGFQTFYHFSTKKTGKDIQ